MTREQLQRLVDAALCTIDPCEEDGCGRFATWDAWEHGRQHASLKGWCDVHCPPCTEERGGLCKEASNDWRLAKELNDLMAAQVSRNDSEGT